MKMDLSISELRKRTNKSTKDRSDFPEEWENKKMQIRSIFPEVGFMNETLHNDKEVSAILRNLSANVTDLVGLQDTFTTIKINDQIILITCNFDNKQRKRVIQLDRDLILSILTFIILLFLIVYYQ